MSNTTQDFLPVEDIHDDVVALKDGSVAMVIQTSAVNFDLLSQNEQLAIIGSFAALLNSLSFAIQIVIRSERLDISKYLKTLKAAEVLQTNPLLQLMMQRYRQFVNNIIRENEVLDKQFYVVISVSSLELGVVKNNQKNFQKAITILTPRRDHIMRQLGRIGLKSEQLTSEKLVRVLYDLYNEPSKTRLLSDNEPVVQSTQLRQSVNLSKSEEVQIPDSLKQAQPTLQSSVLSSQLPESSQPVTQLTSQPKTDQPVSENRQQKTDNQPAAAVYQRPLSNRAPFVVEELQDDYGTPN